MRQVCRTGLFTTLLLAMAATAQSQETLTIEEAVRIGLRNNFDIQVARNSATVARNNAGKGTAGFLPSVDATGNYSVSSAEETTNSPFSFGNSDTKGWGVAVSFDWTIFDGFSMFASRSRYNELARLGEYQARNVIENTVVRISEAYYDLIRQELLLEVAERARDISQDRFEREKVRTDLGGSSSADLLNAQVSFNNDEADLLNQRLAVTTARQRLNILLGRDPATLLSVSNEFGVQPLDLTYDELLVATMSNNSDLLLAQQASSVAEQDVRIRRSAFMPRLALRGSYGYSDRTIASTSSRFDEDITSEETSASIGLVLSLNIFNGRRDWIDLQNARLEARNRLLELDRARNELRGLVRERFDTFEQRLELAALEEANVAAAERNFGLLQDRHRLGATTSLEYRDAQVNLIRAETALVTSRYQARLARLEIEQLMGAIRID